SEFLLRDFGRGWRPCPGCGAHRSELCCSTSAMGLGRVKTKSDLVVMRAEDKFLRFFPLRVTVEPKIPGAVIPRRVFTQPGSKTELTPRNDESGVRIQECAAKLIEQYALRRTPQRRELRTPLGTNPIGQSLVDAEFRPRRAHSEPMATISAELSSLCYF